MFIKKLNIKCFCRTLKQTMAQKSLQLKGKTVNKSQLIEKIAAGADISKAAAGRALDSNPQTGATIEIAAAKIPSFKAGKALKDACNS